MERFAPPAEEPTALPPPDPAITRSKKRAADNSVQSDSPSPKVSKKSSKAKPATSSHSTFDRIDDEPIELALGQTPWNARRQSAQATPRHPSTCFADQTHPAAWHPAPGPATSAEPKGKQTTARRQNDAWAAWSTAHDSFNPQNASQGRFPDAPLQRFPTSASEMRYDDALDSQVRQILATTAHNLGKGNSQPYDFPYKYILRGPEKIKATINSVTIPEHLWGIFRIMHDPKSEPDIKPCLMVHIEQIVEDAREYEWEAGVRRWSEEVFSRISEGRLASGWHSYDEIQRMRMVIAQSKPITTRQQNQSSVKDSYTRRYPHQNQPNQPQQDILKGGPPCPEYNSSTGCTLNSGHIKNGKRLIHICSFCLHQTSASNTHPEAYCRNKLRLTGSNNHFQ